MTETNAPIPSDSPKLPGKEVLDRLFPEVTAQPSDQTFEIGLVLGGTVSAGAYTAGALDLLVQALDAWHEQPVVAHRVKLTVAAGASGGAVCAAILGILSNRSFTHVSAPMSTLVSGKPPINNKFWNVWVDSFEFKTLLETSDLHDVIDEGTGNSTDKKQHVPSIFNCKMIDDAIADLTAYGSHAPDKDRSWIAAPLRIGMTVGNLRGIPYKLENIHPLAPYTGASYVQHDDFVWFAIPSWLTKPSNVESLRRPDEFWVADATVGYGMVAQWAAASGAMPLGLKARALHRPLSHYVYRPFVRTFYSSGALTAIPEWPQPDWPELPEVVSGADYTFSAVDGGTYNNDPVRLVHTAMAGLVGQNHRSADFANRAMLMIDPLVDQPTTLTKVGLSLPAVAQVMTQAFVSESRYLTADMDLFADETVFSRFQLIPNRIVDGHPQVGEQALAGTGLFAMAGWCTRAFRVHDYLLGRTNMLTYLRTKFILRADNSLFDHWPDDRRKQFACTEDGTAITVTPLPPRSEHYLPIIPIADGLRADIPDWPAVGAR